MAPRARFPRYRDKPSPNRLLARHFRARRQALGLSQAALAKIAGVPRGTIAGIETGRFLPSVVVLTRLAEAMDMDLTELVALVAESAKEFDHA